MKRNTLLTKITSGFIVLVVAFMSLLFPVQNSFAVIDRVRNVSLDFGNSQNCNVDDKDNQNSYCKTDKTYFNPFSNNPDILWEKMLK